MKKLVLLFLIFSHITFSMEATENDFDTEVQEDTCEIDDPECEDSLVSWACSLINDGIQKGSNALELARRHPVVPAYLALNLLIQLTAVAADCAPCFQCNCYCGNVEPHSVGVAQNITECGDLCFSTNSKFAKCSPIQIPGENCSACPECKCYCGNVEASFKGMTQTLLECAKLCNFTGTKFNKCV